MLKQIVSLLADGQFHSGEELGEALGISRPAVWKQVQKLDALAIPYSSVRGRGYRLQDPIELLDKDLLLNKVTQRLDRLDILLDVGSTNTWLIERAADHVGKRCAVLAEKQIAGRGRRGRHWVSPFGKNIYLSLLITFPKAITELDGFSLMTAIAVERVLTRFGIDGIALKWPNDVYAHNKKLAGILLEVAGQYGQYTQVVIGVGLNMDLSATDAQDIQQPWVALRSLKADLSRNEVSAALIDELLLLADEFQQDGFAPWQQYWCERDIYLNKDVRIVAANYEKHGVVKGVNRKGELMLKSERGIELINAGEISVRSID